MAYAKIRQEVYLTYAIQSSSLNIIINKKENY